MCVCVNQKERFKISILLVQCLFVLFQLAMSSLIRGNELELAACVGLVLGEAAQQSTAYCLELLARKYMTTATWYVDSLLQDALVLDSRGGSGLNDFIRPHLSAVIMQVTCVMKLLTFPSLIICNKFIYGSPMNHPNWIHLQNVASSDIFPSSLGTCLLTCCR